MPLVHRSLKGIRIIAGFLLLCAAFPETVQTAEAAERSYSYDAIEFDIAVNADSSVDITERQTYRFEGEYHQGWRNIPMGRVDAITDISVTDGDTGISLSHTFSRLDKTDPSSWGKYTTFVDSGEQIIEWYYDTRGATRTFVLRYTVHGAIGFYDDHDELYWNLVTHYTVPIRRIEATVRLPHPGEKPSLPASVYVEPETIVNSWEADAGTFHFTFGDIPRGGKVTIAPGWPTGIVDEGAYWRGFLSRTWGYFGAALAVLVTIVTLTTRWYFTERRGTGRGTIVPQYDPPQNLRPAMAEIVATERLTDRAWTATIVDLAMRGWIEIREEPSGKRPAAITVGIILFVILAIAIAVVSDMLVFVVFFGLLFMWPVIRSVGKLTQPLYFLKRTFPQLAGSLEGYEEKFLEILFPGNKEFSMKEMISNRDASGTLHAALQKLREEVFVETQSDTGVFEVDFRKWKYVSAILVAALLAGVWFLAANGFPQMMTFLIAVSYGVLAVVLFSRFNPRLNRKGQILREEWLGFKMYLETAERYRMQNLTPETFEKYLPYAIIFGVEKKWGKAFEGFAMNSPAWYSSSAPTAAVTGTSPGFSAAVFSTSFVSSFSSAFARSGGGDGTSGSGASGGGGSAGGGGGGGGGGAS